MNRVITTLTRWTLVPVALLALGLGSAARADDVFNACSRNTNGKLKSALVNATPICKATETLRTWNATGPQGPAGPQGPPGFTACHIEEYPGTCNPNTFAVLNSTCSSGLLTGAGAIWHTPFDAADNGPFYLFPRTGTTWTIIPYNHTGSAQDFRFVLTCCN